MDVAPDADHMGERVWFGAFVGVLLVTGCVTTETVPYAYRVPLEASSHGRATAENCVALCRELNDAGSSGFYACLGTCPDLDVRQRACNPPPDPTDNPPVALCFNRAVEREVSTGAGEAVADVIGRLLVAMIESAAEGSGSSSSSGSSSHSKRMSSVSRARGAAPRHTHEPARPRRAK